MDEQELAREAVKQARRDEMYIKPAAQRLEDFKPLYVATQAGPMCPACGRPMDKPGWTHGVGTKWGDACISTEQAS